MSFNGLQFIRGQFDQATSMISGQHKQATDISERIRSFVPVVQGAWIGGDADAFAQDVLTVLIPDIANLIAAIAGMNTNLGSAAGIVDAADQKAAGMADNVVGQFGGIIGGGGGGGLFGGIGGALGGIAGGGAGGGLGGLGGIAGAIGGSL
jgi:hypothetical protein